MKKFSFWEQSPEFIHYTIGTLNAMFYLAVFVLLGEYSSQLAEYFNLPIGLIQSFQLTALPMVIVSYVIARKVIKKHKLRLVQARFSSQEICHG